VQAAGGATAILAPRLNVDPVLILGAGAAGLAAAYSLKKAGIPFHIVEGSHRAGGRILTQERFNADGQFIERGAELVDSNHSALLGLARELGVEVEDVIGGDKGLTKDLIYAGGRLRSEKELVEGIKPLVQAVARAQREIFTGKNVDITYRTAHLLPNAVKYDNMSLKQFLESMRASVDGWILDAVEAAYVGEYGGDADKQSALNLITLFETDLEDGFGMFGESDEAKRIKGGSERLIAKLVEAIAGPDGADAVLTLGARVVSIKENGSTGLIVAIEQSGRARELKATRVICTLPFTVLREVDGIDKLSLAPVTKRSIRTMGYGHNSKTMLGFQKRLWRESGRALPASTGSIFTDASSQAFWETSRMQPGTRGILTNFLGGTAASRADQKTVAVALSDLGRIDSQLPGLFEKATVTNWSRSPWVKGSYACLAPGQWTSIWGAGVESELGGRLYFAGEHISIAHQGMMNGAYETGMRAADSVKRSVGVTARIALGA
jgi:monoamine oxidase